MTRGIALALIIFMCGCGARLNVESEYEVPPAGKLHEIDPIKKDQNIKVSVAATNAPVGVYIYLKKDEVEGERQIYATRFTSLMLAKQEKTEQATLEATIPANQAAIIHVIRAGAKAPKVKVKINN